MRRLIAVTCIVVTAAGTGVTAAALGTNTSPQPRGVASETAAGSASAGKAVFVSVCSGCHMNLGSKAGVGPKLKGLGLTSARIERQVKNGGGMMPSGLVSGAKLKNVVAYVASIQKK